MRHASYIVQCGSVEAVSAIVRLLPGTEHHTENAFFFLALFSSGFVSD